MTRPPDLRTAPRGWLPAAGRNVRRAAPAVLVGTLAVILLAPALDAQERGSQRRAAAADTAPELSADLVGQVVSALDGRPVQGAVVNLLGANRGAITDSAGNFRVPRVLPGLDSVEVRFIGYEASRVELDIAPEATTRVIFLLSPTVVRVADIEVEVRRSTTSVGKLRGFWERRERGFGAFITPAEIEQKMPRLASDLLRGIAGVRVGPVHLGKAPVTMGRAVHECAPNLFLDGIYMPGMEVDDIPSQDVWAMEVYRGASDLPIEFSRGSQSCGTIVVWTPTGERLD